jgi:dephospho-CoA kinase
MRKNLKNRRIILGLTGGFGTGKTTVAGILKAYGARVIDADKIAHSLLKKGTPAYKKIVMNFGRAVQNSDGSINRAKLGAKVFAKESSRKKLNRIMHPEIIKVMMAALRSIKKGVVVLDAPLLLEAGLGKIADKLIVVTASRENQMRRIQKSKHISKAQILKRIHSQMPLLDKVRRADFVIDNNGAVSQTRKQVQVIRRLWWKS